MAQETTFDSNVGGSYQFFSSELWVSAYTAFYLQKKKKIKSSFVQNLWFGIEVKEYVFHIGGPQASLTV